MCPLSVHTFKCEVLRREQVRRCLAEDDRISWCTDISIYRQLVSVEIKVVETWSWIWKTVLIWAASWQNLFQPYANNKGCPRSLISTFVVCYLGSIIPILAKFKISILLLVSVAEQAGLSLTWSETPKTGFLVTWLDPQLMNNSNRHSARFDLLITTVILLRIIS